MVQLVFTDAFNTGHRKPTNGKIFILFKVFGERGPGKRQVSPDYRQMSTEF